MQSVDERELLAAEIDAVNAELPALEDELREMMLPTDPHDGKNVIIEIRGAEGGEEANLFARDLYEMYAAYAADQGWKLETLSSTLSDMGGFNEITFDRPRRHGLAQPEVRRWSASCAARPGDREPGPHPHVVGHGHGVARGRRGRRHDRRP